MRKYIFESYEWKGNNGLSRLKYCPVCGTKCEDKEESLRIRPTCPNCGFVHYRNPSPGVVVLIEQERKILLGKRAPSSFEPGKWCLPGGFIEFDDDFVTSAMREVKEETDLDIEVKSILNVSSNFLSENLHTLVIVVKGHVISGTPNPGDDIVELDWFKSSGNLPEIAFSGDEYLIQHFDALDKQAIPLN